MNLLRRQFQRTEMSGGERNVIALLYVPEVEVKTNGEYSRSKQNQP